MLRITFAFTIALLASVACTRRADAPPPPSEPAVVTLPGLGADVRIVTDRWGIPHLQAHTLGDLYFAWGYVTARDRLWQLELTRRAAGGTLWEWFGNRTLTADGGAQLFRLRERAGEIWSRERTDPAIREPLERYAAGINAWIARCRAGEAPWPAEFLKLGKRPADWEPENAYLVLLAQGMLLDLDLPELDEAQEIREHGITRTIARHQFEDDMVYASIPDSVAERLYGRPPRPTLPGRPYAEPTRTGLRLEGGATIDAPLLAEARRTLSGWLDPATRDPDERASNIFAIGPGRSASGAPMLANDVHLSLGAPGPFHIVHLTVPGVLDAAGASVPGMPLIVSGRNDRCAWGLTSLAADVIDVYADTLSRDGRQVRWRGGWVPITTHPFTLRYRVLGVVPIAPPGQVRRYTPHGPVVAYDKKRRLAMSVRWAGDDQAITLARLLDMPRARSIADLAAAVRTVVTPTSNIVMADRDGHVAYHVVGALPQRGFEPPPGPIPDDSAHEWLGLIAPEDRPHWELGPRDFVVNGNNLPVGAPYHEPFPRYDFMQDRAARMAERLADDPSMTLADLRSVQNDLYSRGAARFLPLLLRCADSLRTSQDRDVRAA
ncbi:MAG TPA: penicillin acylase family protein, partial [Candidatus Eisenbacteria bacterium]|nr:penicillin acylase family protein [Candidatus Eisenbacteria bacterium]